MFLFLLVGASSAHTIDGYCYPDELHCWDAPFVEDGVCHLDPRRDSILRQQTDEPICPFNPYPTVYK